VYRGIPRQHGQGLGNLFKSALRTIFPFLAPVAKSTMNTMKTEGMGAVADMMSSGKSPVQVVKSRAKNALKSVGKATALSLGETLLKKMKTGRSHPSTPKKSTKGRRRKAFGHYHSRHRRRQSLRRHSHRTLDIFD